MATPQEFARQYGALASQVGQQIGVAPNILLGQWGLETGWGRSVIPGTNNLGNIKDFSGGGTAATDNMTGSRDNYRRYETPEAFGQDFAGLLQRRYGDALNTGDDAAAFAAALKKGGYAEDPNYERKLVAASQTAARANNVGDRIAAAILPSANAATAPNATLPQLSQWGEKFQEARRAGYTDAEILQHIGSMPNFSTRIQRAKDAGYSDLEIMDYIQRSSPPPMPSNEGPPPPSTPNAPVAVEQPQQQSPTFDQRVQASIPGRLLRGIQDPIDAGAQMLVNALPEGVVNAVNSIPEAINGLPLIGPISEAIGFRPATAQSMNQDLQQREQAYQAARQATGSEGIDFARLGGNIAATAPLFSSSTLAAATLPGRIASGGAAGTAAGLLNPVTSGDYAEGKTDQALLGGAFGAGGSLVGGLLGRALAPRAASNPQVQTLLNEGVELTPGQAMGGLAARIEDRAISLPAVGDAIRASRLRGIEDLNRAALNRVAAPLGQKVQNVGRDGLQEVTNMVNQAYDDVLPKLTFRADAQFGRELGSLQNMARNLPDGGQQFENIFRSQVMSRLTPQGVADGVNFKQIDSELGRLGRSYRSSAVASERDLGMALTELQSSLRSNLTRSNPSQAAELRKIDQAYAQLTRVERAAAASGAESGVFTPSQLSNAVRAGDTTTRRRAFARGDALMQDLSDAGRSVMNSQVPNSGTADRLFLNAAVLGGGAMVSPAATAGLLAAAVPYLPGVTRAATATLARRPQGLLNIGQVIERYAPAAGLLGFTAQ